MFYKNLSFGCLLIFLLLSGCGVVPQKQPPEKETRLSSETDGTEDKAVAESDDAEIATVTVAEKKLPRPLEEKTEQIVEAKPTVEETPKLEPVKEKEVIEAVKEKKLKNRVVPTDPNTFLVETDVKPKSHPNYGKGDKYGFFVNAEPGKELVVTRGNEYIFKVDTGVKHDFYLTTSPVGWGAETYSSGVEGQFTYKGDVKFKPNVTTPDLLFYQCRNHKSMGGSIYVLDEGENLSAVKSKVKKQMPKRELSHNIRDKKVSERTVKQKLSYASMLMMGKKIKGIAQSGDSQAVADLNRAKENVEAAKQFLAQGENDKALKSVDESIRQMMALSIAQAKTQPVDNSAQKAEYQELLTALGNYDKSYEKNVKRAKKMGQPLRATLNKDEYSQMRVKADRLAKENDYKGANALLHSAQSMITKTLTKMLQSQTVVYDKTFETPKEEYEYELARLESYEELVPIAIEQRRPSKGLMMLMNTYVKKGGEIKKEGLAVASKGDYKMAIMAMQAATDNYIRALRAVGVQ